VTNASEENIKQMFKCVWHKFINLQPNKIYNSSDPYNYNYNYNQHSYNVEGFGGSTVTVIAWRYARRSSYTVFPVT